MVNYMREIQWKCGNCRVMNKVEVDVESPNGMTIICEVCKYESEIRWQLIINVASRVVKAPPIIELPKNIIRPGDN